MKTVIKTLAVAALATGLASTAFATQNDGGIYVGGKLGYNNMIAPSGNSQVNGTNAFKADINNYMANIHVGYLWPVADQIQVGGQLGYSYYGKYKVSAYGSGTGNLDSKLSSFNLLAVGQWNIEDWFVKGRIGAARVMAKNSGNYTFGATTSKVFDSKWLGLVGLSGGYFFNDNLSLELFYDRLVGKNVNTSDVINTRGSFPPSMNSVGLGLTWSF